MIVVRDLYARCIAICNSRRFELLGEALVFRDVAPAGRRFVAPEFAFYRVDDAD
jgi:hypothetical protein